MFVAGIDVGSTTTKALILDDRNVNEREYDILGVECMKTGFDHAAVANDCFLTALSKAKLERTDIVRVVGTGYGRRNIPFADKVLTEIACHARGAHLVFPDVHTIIDIGGQDSKVINIDEKGDVVDFVMNEKCAAGTGRFIEVMAGVLQTDIESLAQLSFSAENKDLVISNLCTVFAESEIISKISQGCNRNDIIRGLHNAIADRIIPMARRIGIKNEVGMTGGVAKNGGVVHAFAEKLDTNIRVADDPQLMGALGAAVFAAAQQRRR